ncbi:MAG: hypothetical protein MUP47_07920 [Phycisphaerae bacterium]|nr:hypothetical protein [Phycisphaerae bacterium]
MAETYTNRTLREMVRIVASRFFGMVLIFAMVVAGVGAATYFAPRWYRSEVKLLAGPGIVGNVLEEQTTLLRDKVSLFVVTQREIVMSDYVLASAMMALQRVAPQGGEAAPKGTYSDKQVSDFVARNGNLMRRLKRRVKVLTPGGPDVTFTRTFTIRVDWSERDVVSPARGDARQAAASQAPQLAEQIKETYLARYTTLESQRAKDATRVLQEQALAAAKANLESASTAFREFVENELKGDLLQVINMVGGRAVGAETGDASLATRFRGEINTLEARLAEVSALKQAIDDELAKDDDAALVVPDAVTKGNPVMEKLQARVVEAKLSLNALEPRYTDAFQEVQNARAELAAARADLRTETTKQSTRLQQESSVLTARHKVLTAKVAEDRKRVDELASKVARYTLVQQAVETAQQIFNEEQRRVVSAVTAEKIASQPLLVSVLDAPSQPDPTEPRRPIVWVNMLIAGVSGLVLALAYAFLADHFDHSIKSIDGAERYLGTPVLASVPKLGRGIIRTK